jgi:hypothetical protein
MPAKTTPEWQEEPVDGLLHAVSHAYTPKVDGFTVGTMSQGHNLQ